MKINYLLSFFVIFGLLFGATATLAQTDSPEESIVVSGNNLPGTLGLFWQTIKENISLLFTFDPELKAEKQLLFSEQRLNLAEKFATQTANPQLQNQAEKMLTRSNDFLDKINNKVTTLTQLSVEKQERLSERLQNHQQLRESAFDRLEAQSNQKTEGMIRELRAQSLEKSQRLINAINNENLSEETRSELEQLQIRIQNHLQEVQEYNQARMQIREQIQAGEPQAIQQMEQLQTQRREQLQTRIQNPNETLDNNESSQTNGLNGNQMSNGQQNKQGANN